MKKYEAPKVTEYGHVKDIVLGLIFPIEGRGEPLGSLFAGCDPCISPV